MPDNIKSRIARLRKMQRWRRGEGEYYDEGEPNAPVMPMPCKPKQFGEDIDALIAHVEKQLKRKKTKCLTT